MAVGPLSRGRTFTDHLRPRFDLPRVQPGMEMPLHLFLAADEHQPVGTGFPVRVLCSNSRRRTSRDNRNSSKGLTALTVTHINSALQVYESEEIHANQVLEKIHLPVVLVPSLTPLDLSVELTFSTTQVLTCAANQGYVGGLDMIWMSPLP